MASPFNIFRKHQKVLLTVGGVVLLLVWVVGDPLMQSLGGGAARRAAKQDGEVVATWKDGEITRGELEDLVARRQLLRGFLQTAFQLAYRERPQEALQPGVMPVVDLNAQARDSNIRRRVVATKIFADAARRAGFVVTDKAINRYLSELLVGAVTTSDLQQILRNRRYRGRQVPMQLIFETLREELLAQSFQRSFQYVMGSMLPEQRWSDWLKANDQIVVEVMEVPTRLFLQDVADPSDAELRTLYEKHKDTEPRPEVVVTSTLPTAKPGFKVPRQVRVEYLVAEFEQFANDLAEEVTEEEVKEFYEANKQDFVKDPLDVNPFEGDNPFTDPPEVGDPADNGDKADDSSTDGTAPDSQTQGDQGDAAPDGEEADNASEGNANASQADAPSVDSTTNGEAKDEPDTIPPTRPEQAQEDAPQTTAPPDPTSQSARRGRSPFRLIAQTEGDGNTEGSETDESDTDESDSEESDSEESNSEESNSEASTEQGDTEQGDSEESNGPKAATEGDSQPAGEADGPQIPPPAPGATDGPQIPPLETNDATQVPQTPDGKEGGVTVGEITPPPPVNPQGRPPEPAPPLEYKSIDEVEPEIRERIARDRVAAKFDELIPQVYARLNRTYSQYDDALAVAEEDAKVAPPEFELPKLAEEFGLRFLETDALAQWELSEAEVGKSIDPTAQRQIPLWLMCFADESLYKPRLTIDALKGNRYLSVKVYDKAAHVPKFKDAAAEVESTFRRIKARDLAEKEAKRLADEAKESSLTLAQLAETDERYAAQETDAFSWLRPDFMAMIQRQARVHFGEPGGVVTSAGPAFMEAAFGLEQGEVGTVFNHDKSVCYVIRLVRHVRSREDLRKTFLAETDRWPWNSYFNQARQVKYGLALHNHLLTEAKLEWVPGVDLDN